MVAAHQLTDTPVYGYDDDEVTLRDGTINVLQEGSPFKVSGSRSFVRDPRLSKLNPAQASRAIRHAARVGLPQMSAPARLKWCSDHPTPKHVDTRLLVSDPDLYWEQRGFVPKTQFTTGKHVCNDCRARHERMLYAARKAEQGQHVRPYSRHDRPLRPTRRIAA